MGAPIHMLAMHVIADSPQVACYKGNIPTKSNTLLPMQCPLSTGQLEFTSFRNTRFYVARLLPYAMQNHSFISTNDSHFISMQD